MSFNRRQFLTTVGAAALPALAPRLSFATRTADFTGSRATVICLFQRGGADGLNMIVPHGDDFYYDLRPTIAVPEPMQNGGALDLDGYFGFHPSMASLLPLYQVGELAVIHATGSPHETRSHFDAMDYMERAYLEKGGIFSGWLGRHLESVATGAPFQAVGIGIATQKSLAGEVAALAMRDIDRFGLIIPTADPAAYEAVLKLLYDGDGLLDEPAQHALAAVELLQQADPSQYQPDNGAVYPVTEFGQTMQEIGQLIKADSLGLEIICADIGGWDHHNQENLVLPPLLTDLANSLSAFYTDMGSRMGDIVVVTMSEFGRRAYENASAGTDHGHGNCMLTLGGGGKVNGGQVYSDWPTLAADALYQGDDLEVTTDWRTVLAELVSKRLSNSALDYVFPDFAVPEFLNIYQA